MIALERRTLRNRHSLLATGPVLPSTRPGGSVCKCRSMEDLATLCENAKSVQPPECDSPSARSEGQARRAGIRKLMDLTGCERGAKPWVERWVSDSGNWLAGPDKEAPLELEGSGGCDAGDGDLDALLDAYTEIDVLSRRRGSCCEPVGQIPLAREPLWFQNVDGVLGREDLPARQGRMLAYRCSIQGRNAVCKIVGLPVVGPGQVDIVETLEMIASLRHPKLCTLLGAAASQPDGVHVFNEDLGGGSLMDQLVSENGKASAPFVTFSSWRPKLFRVVNWLGDILQALCYLHSGDVGIVHGNICLSNILLSADQSSAKLTDTVLNKNLQLNRALTPEHDIRSVGFVVWQLSTGKVIVGNEEEQTLAHNALGGVRGLRVSEESVQASAIGTKGMRALFKACVHQNGSSHVPARTAAGLKGVFCKLQKVKALPLRPRRRSMSTVPWIDTLREQDGSTTSLTGLETSSDLARALARDMPQQRRPRRGSEIDSDLDPFRELSQESTYSNVVGSNASAANSQEEQPLPRKARWSAALVNRSFRNIFKRTGAEPIAGEKSEYRYVRPFPRTGSEP